jgi:glyoxylase I family protein
MKSIEIIGLDHVVLRVRDLDASLAFYCDGLGCVEERRLDELGLIQLRAGSALIDLVPIESPLGRAGGRAAEREGRNVDHFALELSRFDADAIRVHLDGLGIEAGEVAPRYGARGNGPSMYIRDPDDNVVELKGPPDDS